MTGRVVSVSRGRSHAFSKPTQMWIPLIAGLGVEPIRCDLLQEEDVERLPKAGTVVVMLGRKFGTADDQPATWAMNVA